ncbi:hypothetical protein [Variovorax sp. DAIF25]|uniref:hypothetical protein n=1 Tax=Variovorax sp. DAIF25 TaxID=3080983 RepID=UPI003D6A17B5
MAAAAPDDTLLGLLRRVYDNGNSYFDADGNHCHRIPDTFSEAERQALADAGLEPNRFVAIPHDEAVNRLRQAAAGVDLRRAADAFVASMTSSDLVWLTVLPATALGLAMPAHPMAAMGGGSCRVCFHRDERADPTLRAYFRHLQGAGWGTGGPVEGLLALEATGPVDGWPRPTPRDIWVFHRLLDLLRALPADTRYSKARTALKDAKLLRVNNPYRCETVLEALATLGVMQTPEHPGLFTRWTTAVERDQRPSTKVEAPAPLGWWRAADGLDETLVARLFGHLKRPRQEPPAEAAEPVRRKPAAGARAKSIPGPPAAGDVHAVRLREDLWTAAYCHEVKADHRGIVRGRVEYLDLLSPTPPTAEQIAGIGFRDRRNGERWQSWVAGLGKTTGVTRIAIGVPAPSHVQPLPERIPGGQASDLKHLAGWHFPATP